MAKLPWWRWWRAKRRQLFHPQTPRVKVASCVGGLIALDQLTKHFLNTSAWAWHDQPRAWLLYPLAGALTAVTLILTPWFRTSGIFLLAGSLGNGSSELLHDTVANPFFTQASNTTVAFNIADVCLLLALATFLYAATTNVPSPRRQPA